MTHALLLLFLSTTSCAAQSLVDTTWEEAGAGTGTTECPDVIQFGADSYVYLNDCYAAGQDGVVETGSYEVIGDKLTLRNRQIGDTGPRLGASADTLEIRIISAAGSDLVLGLGDASISFHRR